MRLFDKDKMNEPNIYSIFLNSLLGIPFSPVCLESSVTKIISSFNLQTITRDIL